ncbi:hypothetical protein [Pollutibacter soli]|uniref:hypothetical protein n=1 Tax=Pollutibacter soli TaxID=3034157 RepID=UPI00301342BC
MKSLVGTLISCSVFIIVLFLWQEIPDFSISKKINAEKVSSFFTAIGSLLTAVTVYLLYKQIKEQIEDRKASSKPDLYPGNQFFDFDQQTDFPKLTRDNKIEVLIGLISLHNIGLGAAKEITVKWWFKKDVLMPLITNGLAQVYANRETERQYSFVPANNHIDIPLPIMYLASLGSFKNGWSEMLWEELFLEISYRDIHDFDYPTKKFKVDVYVGALYVSVNFTKTDKIVLSNESTMISTVLIGTKK